jgi:putative ABC transport system permease protein
VLLFALGLAAATGVIFGLAPLIHMRAAKLHDTLRAATGRSVGSVAANRFRSVLVTGELALALVLLIGSGLMVKAFWKLQEVDAGFRTDHLLTMRLAPPASNYKDAVALRAFYGSLDQRLNSLPGVKSAAIVSGLPPQRLINANDTMIENFVPVPGGPIQNIDYWNSVSGKYFETVGARLLEGRLVTDADGAEAPFVVVVNQTLAKTYWPKESALGHRVRTSNNTPWRMIVGVVADMKNAALDRPAGTELFFPFAQQPARLSWVVMRTAQEPAGLVSAARAEIRALDRSLPVSSVGTMDEVMASARSRPRFLTLLLTMFSALSLTLAALGIYGVISYAVAQRTNEIGIRMALGAQRGDVLRLVAGNGLRIAVAGAVLGAAGAFALTRFLSGLLFGVSSMDVGTFLAMAGVLVAVTMLACWAPARRASRVDPLVALRYE